MAESFQDWRSHQSVEILSAAPKLAHFTLRHPTTRIYSPLITINLQQIPELWRKLNIACKAM